MNKKFMVVALMAALSTVATANLEDKVNANKVAINTVLGSVIDLEGKVNNNEAAIGKLEQKTEENRVIATQAQNNAAHALIQNNKQDKDIAVLGDKLNQKADVDFVTGQVNDAYNELDGKVNDKLAGKVDKEDFGKLDNEVGALTGKVEAIDQDKNRLENELNNKIDANKSEQTDKDAAQDAEIAKGDRIDKVQNQQIGNLQSQNLDQDKNIQANKDAIAANKAEQDKTNAALENKLNGKADVDFVTGQVNDAYNELDGKLNDKLAGVDDKLAGKVDKEDFNRLDNEVGQITSDVEAIKGDLNNKVSRDELGQELDNRLNAAVQGTIDGKVEGALANKADKEDLEKLEQKTEENRVIATQAQNNAAHALIQNNKQDKEIAALGDKLNQKADVDFVTSQVDQAYNDLAGKVDDKLAGKVDKEDFNRLDNEVGALTGKVEAVEKENERVNAEQDKNIAANKAEIEANKDAIAQNKNDIAANKDAIEKETADRVAADEKLQGQINDFNNKFAGYDGRLSGLEKKVDHLDDKMNKGLSLMAAMNAVDFQNVQTGEMALGAGIGHYGNAQSVALGVAYSPVEDLTVNAKYSITAGDPDSFAVGAGATYKFKVGR